MINSKNLQNVMIKGTKDGLTLHLDDSSSFYDILRELEEKLSVSYQLQKDDPIIRVKVHTGNRKFSKSEEDKIIELIQNNNKLVVDRILSNVISLNEMNELLNVSEIKSSVGIVRSGQILEVPGDLLLIGDVNPGGVVKAAGNVFIIGTLKGSVHAGCNGDHKAVIAASQMDSAQISISDVKTTTAISVSEDPLNLHSAYLNDHKEIIFDRIAKLKK
ncbi:septum site-determining protein MinC [Bacillus massiliigorillae]|uniref:septum site-determining protein MinC n=1 Tax=Bacillus massiliigorillae TaxID=1243664 RepID=UPI0003A6019B|nr:septum site-determining protein MinC [Bacillus massiliigorillae]